MTSQIRHHSKPTFDTQIAQQQGRLETTLQKLSGDLLHCED